MTEQNQVEQSSPLSKEQVQEGFAHLIENGKIFKDPDTFFFYATYDQEIGRRSQKICRSTMQKVNI